jgi:carbonic anhydrase
MSQILNEVLAANERYAATFGGKAKLIITPARHFAVLTCMDARLDPAKFAGLAEGDAQSSATPAAAPARMPFGSLVISYKRLGTREWFIINHTDWVVHE